jgi:hypothetical protein
VKIFRNVLLFVDYIKFDPQSFNCYIFYFFYFDPYNLIWFDFEFESLFFLLLFAFLLLFFLIEFFYLLNLVFILLIAIYFIWNNLENCIFLISSSFNFFIYQIWYSLFWFLFILFKIIYEIIVFSISPPQLF